MNTTSQLYFVKKPTMVSKRKLTKIDGTAIIPTSDIITRDDGFAQVIPFKTASAERLEKKINKTRKRIAMHQKPIEMTPFPEMARQQILSKSIMGQQAALTKKMAEEAMAKQKEDALFAREQVHLDAIRQIAPNIVNQLVAAVNAQKTLSPPKKAYTTTAKITVPKRKPKTKPVIELVQSPVYSQTQHQYNPPVVSIPVDLEDAKREMILNIIKSGVTNKNLVKEEVKKQTGKTKIYNSFDRRFEEAMKEFEDSKSTSHLVVEDVSEPGNTPTDIDSEGSGLRGKGFFSNILKSVGKKIIDKVKDNPIEAIKTAVDYGKQALEAGKKVRDAYAAKTGQDTSEGGKLKFKKAHLIKLKNHYTKIHGAGWFDSFSQGFMLPFQALGEVL
jgi:hypothetical protein